MVESIVKIAEKLGVGRGDPEGAIIALLVVVATVAVVMAVAFYLRGRLVGGRKNTDERFDRLAGVMGRLERLENNLNGFHTESSRAFEFIRADIEKISKELQQMHSASPGGARSRDIQSAEQSAVGDESSNDEDPAQGGASQDTSRPSFVPYRPPTELIKNDSDLEFMLSGWNGAGTPPPEKKENTSQIVAVTPLDQGSLSPTKVLSTRLTKSRTGFFSKIRNIFSAKTQIDQGMLDELEALLVGSDLGVTTVQQLINTVRSDVAGNAGVDERQFVQLLKAKVLTVLENATTQARNDISARRRPDGPTVVLMVGVNGVGKTTTTAKLAKQLKARGGSVIMIAADTFRAAAVEQLQEWGKRLDVPVITGAPESKPSTVVVDGMVRAVTEKADVVLIDTAGRLNTKAHLLQELEGIRNACSKVLPSAPHEVILVLDGSTGMNALSQAREFNEAVKLTGLVITKLDGTPKGGIVVAIKNELGIPVRYIGVGESAEDLKPFIAKEFVDALFDETDLSQESSEKLSAHGDLRRRRRRGGDDAAEVGQ